MRRLALGVAMGLLGCGGGPQPFDGGIATDAGALDAGARDAGLHDAGLPDAGQVDAGPGLVPGESWGNLQFPLFFTSAPGATTTVYGQLWISGRTPSAGATPGVSAAAGFGPVGSDPATDSRWQWVPATFNVDVGNNDEFKADLVAPDAGVWDYAFRYQLTP